MIKKFYLFTTLLLILSAQPVHAIKERVALIIGNSNYQNIDKLINPHNDATIISQQLKKLGFTLIGKNGKSSNHPIYNLNENQFVKTIKQFVKVAKNKEMALIYYAGHGVQFDYKSYLLPVDVPGDDLELVKKNSISLDSILKKLDNQAELTIAIFDACREIPELEDVVKEEKTRGVFSTPNFRGLARVSSKGKSRIVAFSSAANQLAADGEGKNSPYTKLLVSELKKSNLEVGDMFRNVAYNFSKQNNGQEPEVLIQGVPPNKFYFTGDVIINQPNIQLAGSEPLSANDRQENIFWNSIDKKPSKEGYKIYLQKYPNGNYTSVAKYRIKQLSKKNISQVKQKPLATYAKLTIRSNVYGDTVTINGEEKGSTKLDLKLSSGTYELEVSKSGYISWNQKIEVKHDSENLIFAKLEKYESIDKKADNYVFGYGVSINYEKAIKLYHKICNGTVSLGCVGLGFLYETGKGVTRDYEQAFKLYQKSCNIHEDQCVYLGRMYYFGKGVSKDYRESLKYFKKGCKAQNLDACLLLAKMYLRGQAVKKNKEKAKTYIVQVEATEIKKCNSGNMASCLMLSAVYFDAISPIKDFKKTFKYSSLACNKLLYPACFIKGVQFLLGYGVPKNIQKGYLLAYEACHTGELQGACWVVGRYYEGSFGGTKDYKKALSYFRKSCNNNEPTGCVSLGKIYSQGLGLTKNYNKALKLYNKACNDIKSDGCTNLAHLYYEGNGVKKNLNQASNYYQRGCDDGDFEGCIKKGNMLSKSMPLNSGKPNKYYQQACILAGKYGEDCTKWLLHAKKIIDNKA
jgi:uncharacterized protein